MNALIERLHALFGRVFSGGDLLMIFSIRLDETGTDGRSRFCVVGGALATVDQWDALALEWKELLADYNLTAFHSKEFDQRSGEFSEWSEDKACRFTAAREAICARNTHFRIAVGVDRAVHSEIKTRMREVKGFRAHSDYSLGMRWMLFQVCKLMSEQHGDDFGLTLLIEDGPYASGAVEEFSRMRGTVGSRPARFGNKLLSIGVDGKDDHTLQAADSIVGIEAKRLGVANRPRMADRLTVLMDSAELERWYQLMIEEKERRRAYSSSRKVSNGAAVPS